MEYFINRDVHLKLYWSQTKTKMRGFVLIYLTFFAGFLVKRDMYSFYLMILILLISTFFFYYYLYKHVFRYRGYLFKSDMVVLVGEFSIEIKYSDVLKGDIVDSFTHKDNIYYNYMLELNIKEFDQVDRYVNKKVILYGLEKEFFNELKQNMFLPR